MSGTAARHRRGRYLPPMPESQVTIESAETVWNPERSQMELLVTYTGPTMESLYVELQESIEWDNGFATVQTVTGPCESGVAMDLDYETTPQRYYRCKFTPLGGSEVITASTIDPRT